MMAGLYTIAEVAKECGVARGNVKYHVEEGRLPAPYRFAGRLVWNEEQRAQVVAFFRGRQRYQHERTRTAR